MAQTETIRVRVDPELKSDLSAWYRQRGTTMSQAIRTFLFDELQRSRNAEAPSATRRFERIMETADSALAASGEPPLTTQDIVDFVEAVRSERAARELS